MKKKKLIILFSSLFSLLTSLVLLIVMSYPSFCAKNVSFQSTYKNDEVTLSATYYEKKDAKYAVLICPGYSCDRAKWRVMSNLFLANNISVMTFDYSGQGNSNGRIGFDNAKTDEIPKEIDDALTYLHKLSSIDYENIILMGHSMGGRSILRLMYDYNISSADTTLTKKNVKNIILFSPEVNYKHSAQASLFASTDDENEYPWKDYDENAIKGVNVYLFGSTADDVVSDYDILRISERLTGKKTQEKGTAFFTETNSLGSKVTVGVTSGVLHSYQMYSVQFASYVSSSIESITGISSSYPTGIISFTYISWGLSLLGIGLLFFALSMQEKPELSLETELENVPIIENEKKFLISKLILWLPGLLIGFLICCLCIVLPFGSPIMNIPYMCCIAGYGICMLIFYLIKKVKGVSGSLPKPSFKIHTDKKKIIECVALFLGLCIYCWFVLKMTMYNLLPMNIRLFWLFFATILMSVGYYIFNVENDMLKKAKASKKTIILYNLIQYVALFLFVLFYLAIQSYSGFIGQMQNMILMYVLVIPLGSYINNKLNNRVYGSIISAFIFQALMITSAAIIAMF